MWTKIVVCRTITSIRPFSYAGALPNVLDSNDASLLISLPGICLHHISKRKVVKFIQDAQKCTQRIYRWVDYDKHRLSHCPLYESKRINTRAYTLPMCLHFLLFTCDSRSRAATHEQCSTSVDLSATASEPGLEYGRPRRSCYALPLAMRCTAHPEHHCLIVKRPAASMRLNVRECVTSRHAFTSRKNGTQLIALRAD